MPAFQAQTTTSALLAGTNNGYETVFIQNLGPNLIYVEVGAAAAAATGVQVAITTGTVTVKRPPLTAINVLAAVANQVSPADTRYVIQ
jgi:hypothetical protein